MTMDQTYPIFIVLWLVVHRLAVLTISFLGLILALQFI